jgi:hypothetical protein
MLLLMMWLLGASSVRRGSLPEVVPHIGQVP